jgi:hypothetical protein
MSTKNDDMNLIAIKTYPQHISNWKIKLQTHVDYPVFLFKNI